MASFKFGRKTTDAYSPPNMVVGSVRARNAIDKTNFVKADTISDGTSNYHSNRYNPVYDRLEQGSVLEDWVPRDASGINMMFRRIHLRDAIAGPTVDFFATQPWSEFDITGVKDPAIQRFYEEAFSMFTQEAMTTISKDFLVIGRYCASLAFNQQKGYWDDYTAHDPDFLEIIPVPFLGWDPLINIRPSPAMRQFMNNQDERARRIRALMPKQFIEKFSSGSGLIPLDQFNTLFLARRISPVDTVGTSFLSRIVGLWAIEKALMDATVTGARRRVGSLLHLECGIDGVWEPDATELDNVSGLFVQAEEDPVGAVVATRTGVRPVEIRQGGQQWKISDEWQFLSEAKMRALGVSEAIFDGTSVVSNMETARSIMVEQLLSFRQQLTKQLFGKLATILARAHGFINKNQARNVPELKVDREVSRAAYIEKVRRSPYATKDIVEAADEDFKRRLRNPMSMDKALRIPPEQLILPTIHWRKDMKPTQDQAYIELLEKMEEKGLPVPKKIWAAAGGYDLEAALEMMHEDKKLSKQIEQAMEPEEVIPEGGEAPEKPGAPKPQKAPEAPTAPEKAPEESIKDLDKLMDQDKTRRAKEKAPGEEAPKKAAEKNPITHPAPPKDVEPKRNPLAFVETIERLPFWEHDNFAGLKKSHAIEMARRIGAKIDRVADNPIELRAVIEGTFSRPHNRQVAAFLCKAAGLTRSLVLSGSTANKIGEALAASPASVTYLNHLVEMVVADYEDEGAKRAAQVVARAMDMLDSEDDGEK